jgi:hypothetical protein
LQYVRSYAFSLVRLMRFCLFSRVGEECSAAVASLYESCLQDDPKLRPTASQIVAILEEESPVTDAAQPAWDPTVNPGDYGSV